MDLGRGERGREREKMGESVIIIAHPFASHTHKPGMAHVLNDNSEVYNLFNLITFYTLPNLLLNIDLPNCQKY